MSHYETWKQTATYSDNFAKTQKNDQDFEVAREKFFAATQQDMNEYHDEIARNQPVDPKTLVKQQFVMSKTNALKPTNKVVTQDFLTSNSAVHQLTNYSQQKIDEKALQSNPVIDSLDPEVFEVSAKKHSLMWSSKQYRDEEQRKHLNMTTNRDVQNNFDPEIAEKLRETKFNMRVTPISEFSNALNRGRVFTNPKFSSC